VIHCSCLCLITDITWHVTWWISWLILHDLAPCIFMLDLLIKMYISTLSCYHLYQAWLTWPLHKIDQLILGPGEDMRTSMCSCLQWFRKCCATHVPVWPAVHQGTEGRACSLYCWYHIDKGIHKSLFIEPSGWVPLQARNIIGPLSRACTGSTVNIVHRYNRWFPITPLPCWDMDLCVLGRWTS